MSYSKLISIGCVVALIGYLASGPLGFFLVQAVKPQPPWTSPVVLAQNYHFIQDVPFYFGFFLTGGMLMLVASHYLAYAGQDIKKKLHLLVAFGWAVAFFVLISFNYICQTTFVAHLAINYSPDYDSAISIFSMVNPKSLCWANEIWGYGFLGVSTWLMAAYYADIDRFIWALLIANGVVSVATVVLTIIDTDWLMKPVGLIAYFIWNALMIILMVLIYRHHKNR